MKLFALRASSVIGACLVASGWGSAAPAQDAPSAEGEQPRRITQETLSPTSLMTVREIVMAPGQVATPHSHSGSVFVYVIEGEVRSQIDDQPPEVFRTGESWFEPEGSIHTLAQNLSDLNPARLLAVAVAPPGEPFAKAAE